MSTPRFRSTPITAEVEIARLARLLGLAPSRLSWLDPIDPQAIRMLREQVDDVLFDADREPLQRVAAAARLIPARLAATIAQRAFGPLLCARVTGLLDPLRAADIADHLPAAFLADVAGALDPRRASRAIAELPPRQIAAIALELDRRGEHATMGGFAGHLSEEATRAAIDVVDDASLLRIASLVESKAILGPLIGLLSERRLGAIIRTATEAGLWPEAIAVMSHCGERQRGKLADVAAGHDDEVLDGLVRAAQEHGLWDAVLPITRAMSPASRERFTALASLRKRPVLAAIVEATAAHRLWRELLALPQLMPAATRRQVARLIAGLDDDALGGLLAAVDDARLEHELVVLLAALADADLRALAARLVALAGDRRIVALAGAAGEADLEALREALGRR